MHITMCMRCKNSHNSVSCPDIDLNFGVGVAEIHPKHILPTLSNIRLFFKTLPLTIVLSVTKVYYN